MKNKVKRVKRLLFTSLHLKDWISILLDTFLPSRDFISSNNEDTKNIIKIIKNRIIKLQLRLKNDS